MEFIFQSITPDRWQEAAEIEAICFPPNEACSPKSMKARIETCPDCFQVAIDPATGAIAGFLNGIATKEEAFRDEFFTDASLYDPEGPNVMLLGLDVLPQYRNQGLAAALVEHYMNSQKQRNSLILTCLEHLVGMYQKMGFRDLGMANSAWGGEAWHEMRRDRDFELFDVVNETGIPTGRVAERQTAHTAGLRHRTAHVWVVDKEHKQVLLQKRAQNKDSFPGRFDTSSAGHIQAGDEPIPSALRELEEELGIKARPEDLKFLGTFPVSYEAQFHGKIFRDEETAFVHVYEKPVEISELHLQEEEVEAVRWFPVDEVLAGVASHDKTFCVPSGGLQLIAAYLKEKTK